MQYRHAKLLRHGDVVIKIDDGSELFIDTIEIYGQVKKIRLNCIDRKTFKNVVVYHEDVKFE